MDLGGRRSRARGGYWVWPPCCLHSFPSWCSSSQAGLKDTGTVKQLEVLHTAPEPWFLAEVLVMNETTGVTGLFQANRWGANPHELLSHGTR